MPEYKTESIMAESKVQIDVGLNCKRLDYLQWDEYFMATALLSAKRSKDPNTQVGACLVDNQNRIISIGYNGFPRNCHDDVFPWCRGEDPRANGDPLIDKMMYVVHAEANAILNSNSMNLSGTKLYTTLFPCNECAKLIIQSGVREIVYLSDKYGDKPVFRASKRMFDAVGIRYDRFVPTRMQILIDFDEIIQEELNMSLSPVHNPSKQQKLPSNNVANGYANGQRLHDGFRGEPATAEMESEHGLLRSECELSAAVATMHIVEVNGNAATQSNIKYEKPTQMQEYAETQTYLPLTPPDGDTIQGKAVASAQRVLLYDNQSLRMTPKPCSKATESRAQMFTLISPESEVSANDKSPNDLAGKEGLILDFKINYKRLDYLQWDEYFMATALLSAKRSKDPNTQVGACLVDNQNRIISIGYNGFPRNCHDDVFPWCRGEDPRANGDPLIDKMMYVVHAEANAILNSNSMNLSGTKLYTTLFPCNECAKLIVQSGVREIVYLSDKYGDKPVFRASKRMFDAVGIRYDRFVPTRMQILIDFDEAIQEELNITTNI